MSNNDTTSTSLASTTASLQQSLQLNLNLQAKLTEKLRNLSQKKAQNRRLAAAADPLETTTTTTILDKNDAPNTDSPPFPPSNTSKLSSNKRKYTYDPYRKWTRRMFMDPRTNSTPDPNLDTIKRRKLEEGRFFHHTSPPWSKKEVSVLLECAKEQQLVEVADTKQSTDSLDFQKVATRLQQQQQTIKRSDTKTRRKPTKPPRTAEECRLCYHSSLPKQPFTKRESLQIMEQVHLHASRNETPSWPDVCPNRTGWESLTTYQTKLAPTQKVQWTPPQDELLLKYICAMGPQLVLDKSSAAHISSRLLLEEKTTKQILNRASATLVNPNLVRDVWTDEEERKLVLLMKVYKDAPSPMIPVSTHFPNRAAASISQKWHRSLSPEYSMRPFTKEEDKILLEAVSESTDARWTDIAATRFTSRHPSSLYSRWKELASQEDVLERYRHGLKARKKVKGEDDPLSSDDFVIRVKSTGTTGGGDEDDEATGMGPSVTL